MNTSLNIENLTEYNLQGLLELSGDDISFVTEILNDVVVISPDTAAKMKGAMDNDDVQELASEAHKYKSTLNILQCASLVDLLNHIETQAENGNKSLLKENVHQACLAITLLTSKIQQELERFSKAA